MQGRVWMQPTAANYCLGDWHCGSWKRLTERRRVTAVLKAHQWDNSGKAKKNWTILIRFPAQGKSSLLRSDLCKICASNRGMQIDWGRPSLQRLRWGLQHLLSSQLVSQNNLPKNRCLKLSFECKILLPRIQRISATSPNIDFSPRARQDSSYMLNLLKQLQYLAESGICFLASFLMGGSIVLDSSVCETGT